MGELCLREVTDFEFLGTARLVNPLIDMQLFI